MRRPVVLLVACILTVQLTAQLRPYTLAFESTEDISTVAMQVTENLVESGFDILGAYVPAEDENRKVIIFTRDDIIKEVGKQGGLNAFLAAFRIGLTVEGGKTIVSYTTPQYWGNAYARDAYDSMSGLLDRFDADLSNALGADIHTQFGSEDGITEDKLRKYRYMMGMPQFDDTHVLAKFSSYQEAIETIEAHISEGLQDASLVYSVEIPGKNLKLYGFGIHGDEGESVFLPVIDVSSPKHTAFLPYEFLVVDNEVHMLHGRFRIALSFPDLTMGTFMKIVSTPKDIKRILEEVCSGKPAP